MSETRMPSAHADMTQMEPGAASLAAAPDVSIADPGPLGLAGFAMTTFVLSVFNTGMLSNKYEGAVLGLALFYGGLAQFVAGMWEFRKGNTFGALAFTSFGAFWLSFWFYASRVLPTLPTADAHKATGVFLLGWAIFTAYMTIASLRTTGAVAAVFAALTLTFVFLCIGAFANKTGWTKVGGWFGMGTAALAWYASFAAVTNATFKRTLLPVVPLNSMSLARRS